MISKNMIHSIVPCILAVAVLIVACGEEKSTSPSPSLTSPEGTPEVTWTSTGESFDILVRYHYSQGFPVGYTAYARFENTGESGTAEFTVSVTEASTVKSSKEVSFSVAAGEQYTLEIHGGGGATPQINEYSYVYVKTWRIKVESDLAAEVWEAYLISSGIYNSFNPFTVGSVELKEGLTD